MIPYLASLDASTTANVGLVEFLSVLIPIILLLLKVVILDLKHPYFRRLNKVLIPTMVPLLIIVAAGAAFKLAEVAA